MALRDLLIGMSVAKFSVSVDSGQAGFIPAVPELANDTWCAGSLPVKPGTVFHAWVLRQGKAGVLAEALHMVHYANKHGSGKKDYILDLKKDIEAIRKSSNQNVGWVTLLLVTTKPNFFNRARVPRAIYMGDFTCPTENILVTDPCYPEHADGKNDYGEGGFYDRACDATLNEMDPNHPGAGIFDVNGDGQVYGVASRSGWGDGGYSCYYVAGEDGNVTTAVIDYGLEQLRRPK